MAVSPEILSGLLSDPNTAPYMGAAMGLLNSSGASRLPVTMGAAMGNALGGSQQYNSQVLQNAMARLQLGYKDWLLNQMGAQQAQPSQSLSDLNQGQTPPTTPSAKQLKNLSQASGSTPATVGNLLLAAAPGSALTMPTQTGADNSQSPVTQPAQSQGLFPGMNSSERLTMLSGLFTDPGRLASTMYANNPGVKAAESSLAIDQQMMGQAAQNGDAQAYQLWQQKAYQDSGAMQHTFGGVANVLGMQPGGSWIAGRPPEGTTMVNGKVQLSPGALNAITATEMAHKVIPYVNPVTGVTTGYTSAYNTSALPSTSGAPQGTGTAAPAGAPASALSLGPAQTAAQKEIATQSTEQLTEAITAQQAAQQQIAQLGELTANLSALNTSAAKPAKVQIENVMNGLGTTLGMKPFNLDLTNTQAAQKTIVNFTQTATRALGAREPFQAIKFIEQSLPSIKNTPDANLVVSGMLRGLAEYTNARGAAAQDWQAKYGSGYVPGRGTFQGTWQKTASPLAFMMDSFPEFEQKAIVAAAAKNATLRYELQTAAQSKAMMQKQGYWPSDSNQ